MSIHVVRAMFLHAFRTWELTLWDFSCFYLLDSMGVAGLYGFLLLLHFSTLIPSKPPTFGRRDRRRERKEGINSFRLLPVKAIEFLEAILIFVLRISLTSNSSSGSSHSGHAPFGAPAFTDLHKSSQNSKHHSSAKTICIWQNHAPARAWGKSYSAALGSLMQLHIPAPGIKIKKQIPIASLF